MMRPPTQLAAGTTALVIVDLQERLAAAMPPEALAQAVKSTCLLVEAARRLSLPVIVSEQYPQGLGPTLGAVESGLGRLDDAHCGRLSKLSFSVCGDDGFAPLWQRLGRPQCVVVGMESHVCVYQSVRALVAQGVEVHVPADAVVSRTVDNRATGLALMDACGAVVTSAETVVFDLLARAGTDDFKALSRLLR